MKVYCENCKYHTVEYSPVTYQEEHLCKKVVETKDTPLRQEKKLAVIEIDNKDNDCMYYENLE